jgi:hypothetical protein
MIKYIYARCTFFMTQTKEDAWEYLANAYGNADWNRGYPKPPGAGAGMPRQQINNYEGRRFEPSLEIARKIADALHVSLDMLTTPRPGPAPPGGDRRQAPAPKTSPPVPPPWRP